MGGRLTLAALIGCSLLSCTAAEHVEGGTGGGTARGLDPDALAELQGLGYGEYAGKAVVTTEVPETDVWPARVTFDPASGPICLWGEPYSAYYADRGSDDLAILLDGGGACWTNLCDATFTVEALVSEFAEFVAYPTPRRFRRAPRERVGFCRCLATSGTSCRTAGS